MPTNTTGLSIIGFIKWILVISSLPCFVKAWQGIVEHVTSAGYGRFDVNTGNRLLLGPDAVRFGLLNLLYGIAFLSVAWAVWFFWQRYED